MVFDKQIILQKYNDDSDDFEDWKTLHAKVNKTKGNSYSASGSERSSAPITFEVRYISDLFEIFMNLQSFRIKYRNVIFHIRDYDDYMEQHRTVKLEGVANG